MIAALNSPFGLNEVNLNLYLDFDYDAKDKNSIYSFVYIDAKDLNFARQVNGKQLANVEIVATTFGGKRRSD